MSGHSLGRNRRRTYARAFDWLEARARWAAGESQGSIARALGVDRKSVRKVIRMPEALVREASPEQIELLARDPSKIPCPRCGRPKSYGAELCRDCRSELRLDAPVTLRRIPGTGRRKPVELRTVPANRIVQVGVSFGVLLARHPGQAGYLVVDFWDGGPELVNERTLVRVEPSVEVLVGGELEGEEEI